LSREKKVEFRFDSSEDTNVPGRGEKKEEKRLSSERRKKGDSWRERRV